MLHLAPPTVMRDLIRPDDRPVYDTDGLETAAARRRRMSWLPAGKHGCAGPAQNVRGRRAGRGSCVAGCDPLCS